MLLDELYIGEEQTVLSAMQKLDATGRRILFIAPDGVLRAVITDSDIRRYILRGGDLQGPVSGAANYNPKSLPIGRRADARDYVLSCAIDALPLLDARGAIADVVFAGDFGAVTVNRSVDMPVVVMAGGLGTRLYPYTKILPKPLIPVGELPIAEHILRRFAGFGCGRFFMVVNHKKNMIKSYFADCGTRYDITYADEDRPLGTGGGLALLKGRLTEPFFFTNCDVLIEADYADIAEFHKSRGNVITVVCAVKHITIPYGVIELGDTGEIARVTEKPEMSFLTNTGLYVVDPCVVDELAPDTPVGFPDIMERWRARGHRVGVYPVSEQSWMDMGQLEELETMRRRMEGSE